MNFTEILALRPEGDDSASIRAAIERAEVKRTEAINRAGELECRMKTGLLTDDDATMAANEAAAAEARRAADRIGALLREMLPLLKEAEAREVEDCSEALRQRAREADAAFVKLWGCHRDKILEMAGAILFAKREADAAMSAVKFGDEMLSRHSIEDFRAGFSTAQQAYRAILKLAELSPQEADRKRRVAAGEREREAAQRAEWERRAAEGRARVRAEEEAAERERVARTLPPSQQHVPISVTGEPGYYRSGHAW